MNQSFAKFARILFLVFAIIFTLFSLIMLAISIYAFIFTIICAILCFIASTIIKRKYIISSNNKKLYYTAPTKTNTTLVSDSNFDFIVIDFETANEKRTSACSIGITTIKNNQIAFSKEYLIKPYPFYFNDKNISIHGITEKDVETAPTFDVLWNEISKYFNNSVIIAHNAIFDISVLLRTLEHYNIPSPNIDILCTYRISQYLFPEFPCYRLDFLASQFDIELCHHNACSDSVACAKLFLKFIKDKYILNKEDIPDFLGVDFGHADENNYYPCRPKFSVSTNTKSNTPLKAKDFENIEITHYDDDFKNKNIAFTGTLTSMTRAKAMEIVAKGGGCPQDRVTLKTDYLVIGTQDLKIVKDGSSTKMKKATELKSKGSNIEVIGEEQFINMIDEELYQL